MCGRTPRLTSVSRPANAKRILTVLERSSSTRAVFCDSGHVQQRHACARPRRCGRPSSRNAGWCAARPMRVLHAAKARKCLRAVTSRTTPAASRSRSRAVAVWGARHSRQASTVAVSVGVRRATSRGAGRCKRRSRLSVVTFPRSAIASNRPNSRRSASGAARARRQNAAGHAASCGRQLGNRERPNTGQLPSNARCVAAVTRNSPGSHRPFPRDRDLLKRSSPHRFHPVAAICCLTCRFDQMVR